MFWNIVFLLTKSNILLCLYKLSNSPSRKTQSSRRFTPKKILVFYSHEPLFGNTFATHLLNLQFIFSNLFLRVAWQLRDTHIQASILPNIYLILLILNIIDGWLFLTFYSENVNVVTCKISFEYRNICSMNDIKTHKIFLNCQETQICTWWNH